MRAIILAAGRGSRLAALTSQRPKCLVGLAGRPLLDWQLDALRAAGIEEIAIVRGYRAEQIERPSLTYFENPEWAESNMVVSLLQADSWLRLGPCLIAYGDIVYHSEIVQQLARSRDSIAVAYDVLWRELWEARFERPLRDAETFRIKEGRILEIGARPESLDQVEGQYMGLIKTTPAGWNRIEDLICRLDPATSRQLDVTGLLRQLIARGCRVGAVPTRGRWCEVDRGKDIVLYEQKIRAAGWSHDWRT